MISDDSALLLVDLMPRIIALPLAPHSGETVLANAIVLADAFHASGRPVIAVRVDRPGVSEQPPGSELHEAIAERSDAVVVKRSWGAFYGTGLDEELRKHGVKRLVMAGLVTNMGVESTARAADDHGYDVTFAEDAMSGLDASAHGFAVDYVFTKLGTVASTASLTG